MQELLENAINWDAIGNYEKERYRCRVDKAVIHKDTGVLSVDMTLNFIPPAQDMERLKARLIHKLEKIRGVEFHYQFQDVILEEEDILRLYIPHMIAIVNGEYTCLLYTSNRLRLFYGELEAFQRRSRRYLRTSG